MPDYYTLFAGASKNRMKPIMTDILHKVENYKKGVSTSNNPSFRFLEIHKADEGSEQYKKNNKFSKWNEWHNRKEQDRVKISSN